MERRKISNKIINIKMLNTFSKLKGEFYWTIFRLAIARAEGSVAAPGIVAAK